ncbi:MAG: hypothetical protein A3B68_03955 [Candidatus Melainabacteria bacterium RIFCSPHIGHO2_02_FULL_34_12]|nr:MAG: hypothetical protein A3B68_03955 [Candidatus Melainabacteria bacterium RIFCSPHIGHO2_02_FULL_34_12]
MIIRPTTSQKDIIAAIGANHDRSSFSRDGSNRISQYMPPDDNESPILNLAEYATRLKQEKTQPNQKS